MRGSFNNFWSNLSPGPRGPESRHTRDNIQRAKAEVCVMVCIVTDEAGSDARRHHDALLCH